MNKKSAAYYRYKEEQAKGVFPYFGSDEIEQIAYDLLDDQLAYEAMYVLDEGLMIHRGNETLTKLKIMLLIHFQRIDEARELFLPYKDDGTPSTETLFYAFEVVDGRSRSTLRHMLTRVRRKETDPIDFVNFIDEMWGEIPDYVKYDYLNQAVKDISDNAEALSRIGAMLMDFQMYRQAMTALDKSLDIDAYNIFTWQDLARCAFETYDIEKCKEACEFGLAIDPENPLLHFIKGVILLSDEGKYKEALDSLLVCRSFFEGEMHHNDIVVPKTMVASQISMTYEMIGKCYAELNMVDKAIESYEKYLAREPENHEVIFELAQCYLEKGDLPQALDVVNRAIKLKRRSTPYLALKVSILATMNRFEEAMEMLDKIIKIKPKAHRFVLAKAELAIGIQNVEIADQEFRKLLSMKPTDQSTIDLMREYFESIGDKDALKQIETLL